MTGEMTRIVTAALALLVLAVSAAAAQASVTVGVTDLNQWTPNVSIGCSQEPYFGYPTGASTCTYYTTAVRQFSTDGTNIVPRGFGVITKIRVKTANVPQGPMQVVAFRSIRQSNSTGFPGCCWPQYATATFTPAPGGVTEINTALPVMNATLLQQYVNSGDFSFDPGPDAPPWVGAREVPAGTQGIENFDQIGLTVLDASTPIPATNTGDSQGPAGAALWPALSSRSLRADVAGLNGVQVLLQGLWEPDADRDGLGDETQDPDGGHPHGTGGGGTTDGGQTGGGEGTQQQSARLTIPANGQLVGRRAQIELACKMATTCSGTLRLQDRSQGAGARAAARKATVYGSARFSIPAGRTRTVRIRLTRAGKKKLAKRKSLTVFTTATVGGQVVSSRLTLRR
jgi:hypothetical protein